MNRQCTGAFFVLLPTLECNLRCGYCFESHPAGRWSITETRQVLEKIFAYLAHQRITDCRFHWQGGEPLLMGTSYWAQALPMAQELAARNSVELHQSMQTNLVLYDSRFACLVRDYLSGILGTSFELSPVRCLHGGSHAGFCRQWQKAYKSALDDGVNIGVLCLLDDASISMGFEEYARVLRTEYGINNVRFTLPFSPPGRNDLGFWMNPASAGRFFSDAYRVWHDRGEDTWMEIRPFQHLKKRFLGENAGSGLCIFARNCSDGSWSISPDGEVLLCDNFVNSDSGAGLGNIFQQTLVEIHDGKPRKQLGERIVSLIDEECCACRYLRYCFGGCIAKALPGGSRGALKYKYCLSYRMLFETIEKTTLRVASNSKSCSR